MPVLSNIKTIGVNDSIPIKSYSVNYSNRPLNIDGKLSDQAWKKAAWTDLFVDIEGDVKPKPLFDTRVKMLWDSQYLYIAANIKEPHLWATLLNHDDIILETMILKYLLIQIMTKINISK